MADIIYFGTNGESGHYPMGIDKTLSNDEYNFWNLKKACPLNTKRYDDFRLWYFSASGQKLLGFMRTTST